MKQLLKFNHISINKGKNPLTIKINTNQNYKLKLDSFFRLDKVIHILKKKNLEVVDYLILFDIWSDHFPSFHSLILGLFLLNCQMDFRNILGKDQLYGLFGE